MNVEFGTIRQPLGQVGTRWPPSRAKLRGRLHGGLLLLDMACIFGSYYIASALYAWDSTPDQWWVVASMLAPIYLGAALNARAYSAEVIQEPGRGVVRAVQAFALAGGTILLIAFYLKTSQAFSRGAISIGAVFAFASLAGTRHLFLRRARKLLGGNPYSIVLITDGTQAINVDGFSMVIAADDMLDPREDSPQMFDRLATVLRDSDRVIVACAPEARLGWVRVLKGAAIRSEIVTPELSQLAPLDIGAWNHSPTLVVADGPLSRFDSFMKRAFDVALSATSLLILSPVLCLVALLIKFESPGPVFFVQTRIGKGNQMFRMLKFRSMRSENCDGDGHRSTGREDDRITRVGGFIRRTSIDELPQLINVLLGDMSIVGPRPHALGSRAEDKLFWEIDDRYWHRHACKPGLTGLAQIRGYRGATLREQDLTDRLQADLEYINDWSIWRDVKIILMTFTVLMHKNAY